MSVHYEQTIRFWCLDEHRCFTTWCTFSGLMLAVLMAALRFGQESKPFLSRALPSMGGPKALFPADFGYDLWVI
jgi:hypothetical protein